MVQQEFKDLVFKFSKEASKGDVAYIFLFGSVANGHANSRSDVDLLVVFDTDKEDLDELGDRREVSELALDLEKEFDRNIQVVFSNRNFDGLDPYFIRKVMLEGILLYAESPKVEVKGLELEPYVLILYNSKNLERKEQMRIRRLLHGHKTRKKVKGKTYESVTEGIVQDLDGRYIAPGVIAVSQKNARALEEKLESFKIQHKRIDMWLAEDDITRLRSRITIDGQHKSI